MAYTKELNELIEAYHDVLIRNAEKKIKKLESKNKSLEEQAFRDSLTKLYNRNYYNANIEDIFKKSIEKKQKVGLYIIDLNNFKYVNDTVGHAKGDDFLKIFSYILKKSVRECDEIVRLGGDEFIVVTRNATPLTEPKMRERLDNELNSYNANPKEYIKRERLDNELNSNNTDPKKDIKCDMTISAGYALINPLEKNAIESAFEIADQNMYKEKHIFHRKKEKISGIRDILVNYINNINKSYQQDKL